MNHSELVKEIVFRCDVDRTKTTAILNAMQGAMRSAFRTGNNVMFTGIGQMLVKKKPAITIKNNNINAGIPTLYPSHKTVIINSPKREV